MSDSSDISKPRPKTAAVPQYTVGEEIMNSVTLGVGCLLLALGAVFTVLIGWGCIKLIPMMFRGFVSLCRRPFQKKRGECR